MLRSFTHSLFCLCEWMYSEHKQIKATTFLYSICKKFTMKILSLFQTRMQSQWLRSIRAYWWSFWRVVTMRKSRTLLNTPLTSGEPLVSYKTIVIVIMAAFLLFLFYCYLCFVHCYCWTLLLLFLLLLFILVLFILFPSFF